MKVYPRLGYHLRQLVAYPVLFILILSWVVDYFFPAKFLKKAGDKMWNFIDVIKMSKFQGHIIIKGWI